MAKIALISVAAAAVIASGCTTTEVPVSQARAVPAGRNVWSRTADADAKITVVRDSGVLASNCYLALYINQRLAARFNPAESATFDVPSGELLIAVARDPSGTGLCSTALDKNVNQIETTLKPGQRKTFRMTSSMEYGMKLMPIPN